MLLHEAGSLVQFWHDPIDYKAVVWEPFNSAIRVNDELVHVATANDNEGGAFWNVSFWVFYWPKPFGTMPKVGTERF